jgi:hypothetical protein
MVAERLRPLGYTGSQDRGGAGFRLPPGATGPAQGAYLREHPQWGRTPAPGESSATSLGVNVAVVHGLAIGLLLVRMRESAHPASEY